MITQELGAHFVVLSQLQPNCSPELLMVPIDARPRSKERRELRDMQFLLSLLHEFDITTV